jgi:hypothetical protein
MYHVSAVSPTRQAQGCPIHRNGVSAMQRRWFLLLPVILFATVATHAADLPADAITVTLTDTTITRPGAVTGVLAALLGGGTEKLKRGELTVDGETFALFLPQGKTCTIKNTGSNDGAFENKSTAITVAPKGDGKLTDGQSWFANLPLRVGDRMFDVLDIAADGSKFVLKPSTAPLRGVVLGRKCPAFAFETSEGKKVSFDTYRGQAFLLDIWSTT